jgi:hypothetical protein
MAEMLDQCVRLREQETRWIEEIVNLTNRIETLNGQATPDQVRSLLELRRRYLDQIRMLKETSRALEDRAFRSEPANPESEPVGAKAEPTGANGHAETPPAGDATVEEILDVEFEDLDQKLRSFRQERDQALANLARIEAKYETETELREGLEKRLAATEKERDQAIAAKDAAETETSEHRAQKSGLEDRIRVLEEENSDVIRRLAEAESLLVESEKQHREQENLVATLRREKENGETLLQASREEYMAEKAAREKLEKDLEAMTAERDKTLGLLADSESRILETERRFEDERKELLSKIESAQYDRDAVEARRLDELRRLRSAVRRLTSRVDEEILEFTGGEEE